MTFDFKPLKSPPIPGFLIGFINCLLNIPVLKSLIGLNYLTTIGIKRMRKVKTQGAPHIHPLVSHRGPSSMTVSQDTKVDSLPWKSTWSLSSQDFVKYYQNGRLTPEKVAALILDKSEDLDRGSSKMGIFISQQADDIMAQAAESAKRYAAGDVLGPLDGVPVAVKDELDQVGYPTTAGTKNMSRVPQADATAVARLRAAGALLIGKTNMQEVGFGITGINPHYGQSKNPYDLQRMSGGSSGGSAVAVGVGLCPLSLGADGGGSIRVPAAFCGVLGLKPTYGRVSEVGAYPLCWNVAHVGPIGMSAYDVALGLSLISGEDKNDPLTINAPPLDFSSLKEKNLTGIRVGVCSQWNEMADPEVYEATKRMISLLKDAGAEVKEVTLPDLDIIRAAHYTTIMSEITGANITANKSNDFAGDTRLIMSLSEQMKASDYIHGLRLRDDFCHQLMLLFNDVDLIATPTTGCTARKVNKADVRYGTANLMLAEKVMRYVQLANLTGNPAISIPAGYDRDGLPIGFQLIADYWCESLLLRCAHLLEGQVNRRSPKTFTSEILVD